MAFKVLFALIKSKVVIQGIELYYHLFLFIVYADDSTFFVSHKLTIINPCLNYFEAARIIQTKKGAQQDLIKVRLYFLSRELLTQSSKH